MTYRVGGNGSDASAAVGIVRRAAEDALLTDLHGGDAEVPASDDAAGADREGELLASIARRVEEGAVLQSADVVGSHVGARGGLLASALNEHLLHDTVVRGQSNKVSRHFCYWN